ncbi:hypothetical protein GYMLUDRAFT_36967 [Collybiopsis luxurians FD-317 M1]|nr:hypothetical protein GYMLUDRAFT_36967 [Collybiopsis luxurians FD-317 M1]
MSRFTASPFHKPSPFEFPRAPLSPPETMSDLQSSAHPSVLGVMSVEPQHVEPEPSHNAQPLETPGARFRRVSSLAYHSSGLRESRERTVQRASKFSVVIVPPAMLLQEHGQLGHTLSLGPRHRLSQGMLMPLFPTMYGQLTAIAKEFNFPSTSGICLYFHFAENGITATPRISDDSWSIIWSNVLDPSVAPPRVPIVGKLEFDIDLRHARWYAAWIGSAHRERLDVPASVGPSTAPSLAHFRGDSRTTDLEINLHDDTVESESVSPASGRLNRHVPRKLSLVDRLDSSLRAVAIARNAAQETSPEHSASVRALSPIFQEDEPKTAKLSDSLEKRVNSWRASASLTSSALVAKGQTSLEPANLPNTMPLDNVADQEADEELNLEDFTWSVSSLGPNDWEDGSVASWGRLPSVHVEHRMALSVAMTPSECTSFGPSDYTLPPPVPSLERVLTPDIAHRMYEDCPPTPSTATSWGPPSDYPASPLSFGRVSSVDIGDRVVFSPPLTPMTATSWGPPSEYPPSPMNFGRAPSVHLGDRILFSSPPTPTAASRGPASWPSGGVPHAFNSNELVQGVPWGHAWPYQQQSLVSTSISVPWGHTWPYFHQNPSEPISVPWVHVWPYQQQRHISTPVSGAHDCSSSSAVIAKPWGHSWPYTSSLNSQVAPWRHSWPYNSYLSRALSAVSVRLPCAYPSLNIYPSVYPYFDIYPAEASNAEPVVYPSFDLYPAPSSKLQSLRRTIEVTVGSAYPTFEIYPVQSKISLGSCGYPDFNLYPPLRSQPIPEVQVLQVAWNYPVFDLYPSVYPNVAPYPSQLSLIIPGVPAAGYPDFDMYPPVSNPIQSSVKEILVRVTSAYPDFEIYPKQSKISTRSCGYPDFDLYPPVVSQERTRLSNVQVVKRGWRYPIFDLYPGVYPFIAPYPSELSSGASVSANAGYDVLSNSSLGSTKQVYVKVASAYPNLCIYPTVGLKQLKSLGYPDFDIYPPILQRPLPDVQVTKLAWSYPILDLYPAVYPYVTPYPSKPSSVTLSALNAGYPALDIYPAVSRKSQKSSKVFHIEIKVTSTYPNFEIYSGHTNFYVESCGYPHLNIYPPVSANRVKLPDVRVREFVWSYPIFDLYPAVYPHITPYPSITSTSDKSTLPATSRSSQYPDFVIYPCRQYPDFDLYHSISDKVENTDKSFTEYPDFDIYPAVYPYLVPYRSIAASMTAVPPSIRVVEKLKPRFSQTSHRSLHFEVFPDGLVSTPSGTLQETPVIANVRQRKSHRILHDEVFPNGIVSTPSGTVNIRRDLRISSRPEVPPRPVGGRVRSGSVSQRPLSSAVSPVIGLPPRPNFRLSTYQENETIPVNPSVSQESEPGSTLSDTSLPLRSTSLRVAAANTARTENPLRRAASTVTPSTRMSSLRDTTSGLAPVAEVERSASLVGRRSVFASPQSAGDEGRPSPRKRDSVVLQRIRAFEETGSDSRLSKTLREFPLPPPPPPPTSGLPPPPMRRLSSLNQSRS